MTPISSDLTVSGTHRIERKLKAIILACPSKRGSSRAFVVRIASPLSMTRCTTVRLIANSFWLMDSCSQLRAIRMAISPVWLRSSRSIRKPRSAPIKRTIVSITICRTSSTSRVELMTCPIPANACKWLKRCSNGMRTSLMPDSEFSRFFNPSTASGICFDSRETRSFAACWVTATTCSLIEMGLVLAVSMMFPSHAQGPLLIGWELLQGFALEDIANSLDDHLLAYVERGAAGLVHVCDSGSIKGCLVFVQKDFDLIGFLWQDLGQF